MNKLKLVALCTLIALGGQVNAKTYIVDANKDFSPDEDAERYGKCYTGSFSYKDIVKVKNLPKGDLLSVATMGTEMIVTMKNEHNRIVRAFQFYEPEQQHISEIDEEYERDKGLAVFTDNNFKIPLKGTYSFSFDSKYAEIETNKMEVLFCYKPDKWNPELPKELQNIK